jgi:hypothetical protein
MTTDDIEKYFGSAEKVAAFFDITSEAVYQWRNRPGRLIPKGSSEAAYRTDGSCHFAQNFMGRLAIEQEIVTTESRG